MKALIIMFLFPLTSCVERFNKEEVYGIYAAVGYKNTFDTLWLKENEVYHRKVYDKNKKLVLEMDGKWTIKNNEEIQFYSFYFNLDDDLIKFPESVKDTTGGRSAILETDNGTIQFCVGYYQGENCYQKIK